MTRSDSGPRTGLIAGSDGEDDSDSAGTPPATGDGAPTTGATGADVPRAQAPPNRLAQATTAVERRARQGMFIDARYTLAETYDKRKLTLVRGAPRFVTLSRHRRGSSEGTDRVTLAVAACHSPADGQRCWTPLECV